MKKLLLTLVSCLLCTPMYVSALTLSTYDLGSRPYTAYFVGAAGPHKSLAQQACGSSTTAQNSSTLTLWDFWGASQWNVTISQSGGNTYLNFPVGSYMSIDYDGDEYTEYMYIYKGTYESSKDYDDGSKWNYYSYTRNSAISSVQGEVKECPKGGYYVELTGPFIFTVLYSAQSTPDYNSMQNSSIFAGGDVYDKIVIWFDEPTAIATDTGDESNPYYVTFKVNGNEVMMSNLGSLGAGYTYKNNTTWDYDYMRGTINRSNKTITFPANKSQIAKFDTDVNYIGYGNFGWGSYHIIATTGRHLGFNYCNTYLCSSHSGTTMSPIVANYTGYDLAHSTSDNSNRWVATMTGGALTTGISAMNVSIGDYELYNLDARVVYGTSSGTSFTVPASDCTHDLTLTMSEVTGDNNSVTVRGSLGNKVKSDYVYSYDLYMLPGNITSLSGQTKNTATGIAGAVCIQSGISPSTTDFNYSINPSDYSSLFSGIFDQEYATVFVKTNYNADSGLYPTFHALTSLPADVEYTSVESPVFSVSVDGGEAEAGNAFTFMDFVTVTLSAADGAQIYYTLDDTKPNNSSSRILYTGPFVIDESKTLKAVAYVGSERSGISSVKVTKTGPTGPAYSDSPCYERQMIHEDFSGFPNGKQANTNSAYTVFSSSVDSSIFSGTFSSNSFTSIIGCNCYEAQGTLQVFAQKSGNAGYIRFKGIAPNSTIWVKVKAKNLTNPASTSTVPMRIQVVNNSGATQTFSYVQDNSYTVYSSKNSIDVNVPKTSTEYSFAISTSGLSTTEPLDLKIMIASKPTTNGYRYALFLEDLEIIATPFNTSSSLAEPTNVSYTYDEETLNSFTITSTPQSGYTSTQAYVKNMMVAKKNLASVDLLDYDFTQISGFSTDESKPTELGLVNRKVDLPYAPDLSLRLPVLKDGALGFRLNWQMKNSTTQLGNVFIPAFITSGMDLSSAEKLTLHLDTKLITGSPYHFMVSLVDYDTDTPYELTDITEQLYPSVGTLHNDYTWQVNISDIRNAIRTKKNDPAAEPTNIVLQFSVTHDNGISDANKTKDFYMYLERLRISLENVAAGSVIYQVKNVMPSTNGTFTVNNAALAGDENVANNYYFTVRGLSRAANGTINYSPWYLDNGEMIPVKYQAPVVLPDAPDVSVVHNVDGAVSLTSGGNFLQPADAMSHGTATVTLTAPEGCTVKYALKTDNINSGNKPVFAGLTDLGNYTTPFTIIRAATLIAYSVRVDDGVEVLSEPLKIKLRMLPSEPVFIIPGGTIGTENGQIVGKFYDTGSTLEIDSDYPLQGTCLDNPVMTKTSTATVFTPWDVTEGYPLYDSVDLTVRIFSEWNDFLEYNLHITKEERPMYGTEYVPFDGDFKTVQIGNSDGTNPFAYIICAEEGGVLYGMTRNREDDYNDNYLAVAVGDRVKQSNGHFFNDSKNAASQFLMEFFVGDAGNNKYYFWSIISDEEIECLIENKDKLTGFRICETQADIDKLGDGEYGFLRKRCREGVLCTPQGQDALYLMPKVMVDFYNELHAADFEDSDKDFSPILYKFQITSGTGASLAPSRVKSRAAGSGSVISFSDDDTLNVMALDSDHTDTKVFRAGPSAGSPVKVYSTKEGGTTTPVETIKIVDPACPIIVDNGAIIILLEGEEVAVYNTVGAEVYRGTDRRINLKQGIYIVVVGEDSYKVAVK